MSCSLLISQIIFPFPRQQIFPSWSLLTFLSNRERYYQPYLGPTPNTDQACFLERALLLQHRAAGPGVPQSAVHMTATTWDIRPDQPTWPYAKGVCTGVHAGKWLPLSLHAPFHTTLACHQAVTINLTLFCMIALWESYKKGITFKIFRCLFYSLLLEPAAITKLYITENYVGNGCEKWIALFALPERWSVASLPSRRRSVREAVDQAPRKPGVDLS